jgi:hypothetical protein
MVTRLTDNQVLVTVGRGITGVIQRLLRTKLQEIISVKDFGAVGDGATDDTAAFTAASASGLYVVVPPGQYFVTANFPSSLFFAPGGAVTINGGGSVTFYSTLPNNSVTVAKMQQIATQSFLGRNTAGTGNVEVLSVATVLTMLGTLSASVLGAYRNLVSSATGLSANVAITCDEIILENSSNAYQTVRNVSVTVNTSTVGANGLDTGVLAATTWYSLWLIWNGTTTSGLISLSATAPTLPGGYTHKARIGYIRTDASGSKFPLSYVQAGRKFQYKVVTASNVPNLPIMASGTVGSTTVPTWVAIATGAFVPPTAVAIKVTLGTGGLNGEAMIAPSNLYGAKTSTTNPPFAILTGVAGTNGSSQSAEMMLESTNIYWASGVNCYVLADGWEDNI